MRACVRGHPVYNPDIISTLERSQVRGYRLVGTVSCSLSGTRLEDLSRAVPVYYRYESLFWRYRYDIIGGGRVALV